MRLLPNKETAMNNADELTEALNQYMEGIKSPNRLRIYLIVYAYTLKPFRLLGALLLTIWVTVVSIYGVLDIISLSILFPLLILLYGTIKTAIGWSNEFVMKE